MVILTSVLGIIFIVLWLFLIAGWWDSLGPPSYHPMPPDEELDWLMNVHGLSKEDAEQYMNGPPVL